MAKSWRPRAARRELEERLTAQEARALEAAAKAEKDSALLRADLRAMRSHLTTRDLEMRVELSKAVDHAKQLAESLDQERSERSILLAALVKIAESLKSERSIPQSEGQRAIGGSIAPGPLSADGRIEVRSQFGNRWVSGFAVHEVILGDDGSVGYRLRRGTDGFVLPAVFPEADVRAADSSTNWTPVGSRPRAGTDEFGSF
ncbi:MAG: hypothetical protein WCG37_10230 [Actinomycetes bacterium]